MSTERFAFARSVSQRRVYRSCGTKYLLKYGQGWDEKTQRIAFAFGILFQDTLNEVLRGALPPAKGPERLQTRWHQRMHHGQPLKVTNERITPEVLLKRGPLLMAEAINQATRLRLGTFGYLDKSLTYELTPGLKGTGRPDWYGEGQDMWQFLPTEELRAQYQAAWTGWTPGIIDFKTSGQKYGDLDAELDEQLTEYQIAHSLCTDAPLPRWLALMVCIYTTDPKVQWLVVPARDEAEINQHIHSAMVTDRMIREEHFIRNPKACFEYGKCEYLPLCYPSQRHLIAAELTQRENPRALDELEFLGE